MSILKPTLNSRINHVTDHLYWNYIHMSKWYVNAYGQHPFGIKERYNGI